MPKLSPEQLATEWSIQLETFPVAVREYIRKLAEQYQALLAEHFYSQMLQDPVASSFLTHEQVRSRLYASMQRWIVEVFSLREGQELETVVAHQIKVGEVHARVSIPVHIVLRGARHLKDRFVRLVLDDENGDERFHHLAIKLISVTIDLAMEVMSYAYTLSHDRSSRAEEAYRLFAVAQDIASEKERQRAALLDWENQLMFEQAVGLKAEQLPRIGPSEFGLWFRHKGAHAFEGAPETALILQAMELIDEVLLPAFGQGSGSDGGPGRVQQLRELREKSRSVRYHLDRLFEQSSELESGRDVLTRLLNRKFLPVVMSRQVSHARNEGKTFAVLAIDIDHFKQINDNFGHDGGDHVLQHLAALLVNTSRAGDYLFRLGGEEFLMLLVDISPADALRAAEKLRKNVAAEVIKLPHSKEIRVTVSVGLAMFNGHPDYQLLLSRADDALYRAKNGGRNQVAVAES